MLQSMGSQRVRHDLATEQQQQQQQQSLMCTPRAEQRPLQREESEHRVASLGLIGEKQAEGMGAAALQAVVAV